LTVLLAVAVVREAQVFQVRLELGDALGAVFETRSVEALSW